jgi:small-conductance mechanosensitive channel
MIDLFSASHGLQGVALVVIFCLTYLISQWLTQRISHEQSVWLGDSVHEGLIFPFCALILCFLLKSTFHALRLPIDLIMMALPLLVFSVSVRLIARVLLFVAPHSPLMRALEKIFFGLAGFICVLWVSNLLPEFLNELESIHLSFGKSQMNLRTLLEGLVSLVFVLIISLWLSAGIERQLIAPAVQDLSMRKVLTNLLRTTLMVVGFLVAMSSLGVDLTALSVLGGALGVGLGFGLQKLAANYVSGFVILLERSIRIGDYVKVENFEGEITDIKTRFTLIRSFSGRESIVPNELLISQPVENYSLEDPQVMLSTSITLDFHSDEQTVKEVLLAAALSCPRVLKDPEPSVLLQSFEEGALKFKLTFWIKDPESGQQNVLSQVNYAVLKGLREAKIQMPMPQRQVFWSPTPGSHWPAP